MIKNKTYINVINKDKNISISKHRIVPFSSKLAFGIGQFAEGLKNTGFSLFILFYYNQVLGVSGTLVGSALFIALLFDAVSDPFIGSLSDNFKSRLGRRHPFMYASAIPLALSFVGLFSPPDGLGEIGLFAWLTLFSVLTRGSMTLYHVPHLALGAELTDNFEERTKIVAFRQFFGTAGGAAASIIGLGYFFSDANGGRLAADNYIPYAITLAVLMATTILWSAWGTRKEIPYLHVANENTNKNSLQQAKSDVVEAFKSASFRWIFFGILILFIMAGVNFSLDLYMLQYFWELSGNQMLNLQVSYVVGMIAGVFSVALFHTYIDKKDSLMLGVGVWALFQVSPVLFRMLEWFPDNDSAGLIYILGSMKFIQGLLLQQALISLGSMMADVADEHEVKTGARREGIFFGALSFSGKATSGAGSLIAGVGLDLISWPRGAELTTAATVHSEAIYKLGLLYGPFVAFFGILSLWCFSHYKLSRERHEEILNLLGRSASQT